MRGPLRQLALAAAVAVGCECPPRHPAPAPADAGARADTGLQRLEARVRRGPPPRALPPLSPPVSLLGALGEPASLAAVVSAASDGGSALTVSDALLASARLPELDGEAGQTVFETLAVKSLEATRAEASLRPAAAGWRALGGARLALGVGGRLRPEPHRGHLEASLEALRQVAPRVTGPELEALAAGCRSLDEGAQAWLADVRRRAFDDENSALEALSTGRGHAASERAGGLGPWLDRHDAELALVSRLASGRLAPAPAVMERLASERRALWGHDEPTSLLDPQQFSHWALRASQVRGTCIVLTVLLDARARGQLAPTLAAVEAPHDLLAEGPWEYLPDGVGGRLLRSAALDVDGAVVRVELAVDAPPSRPPGPKKAGARPRPGPRKRPAGRAR